MNHFTFPIVGAAALLAFCHSCWAFTYAVVEPQTARGDEGTYSSSATSINEAGAITVDIERRPWRGIAQVCLPEKDRCKVIDRLDRKSRPRMDVAEDVNASGQVIGFSLVNDIWQAYLRQPDGSMQALGSYNNDPTLQSWAHGINDSTVVVGAGLIGPEQNRQRGFYWKNGVMTWIGTLGGQSSTLRRINAAGQAVGQSSLPPVGQDAFAHAIVYDTTTGVMTDMGTLGGDTSEAWGINGAGDIAGFSSLQPRSGDGVPIRTVGGVMQSLGNLPGSKRGYGYAINDKGDVVGVGRYDGAVDHGFIFTTADGLRDLNDLLNASDQAAYTVLLGADINNAGDIAGIAMRTSDGKWVAVKLVRRP